MRSLLHIWIISVSFFVMANNSMAIDLNKPQVIRDFDYFVDTAASLTIETIDSKVFTPFAVGDVSEINTKYITWIKIVLEPWEYGTHVALLIDQANIDSIELFQRDTLGTWLCTAYGNDQKFDSRKYKTNHFVFDVKRCMDASVVYLRINNRVGTPYNIVIGERQKVLENENSRTLLFGIFLGVIVVMTFYNLFLYISIRERVYLIYVFHTIFVGFLQSSISGFSFQYFWPNMPQFQNFSIELFVIITSAVGIVFMNEFLKTKENFPLAKKVSNWFIGIYFISGVMLIFNFDLVNQFLKLFQPIVSIFVIATAVTVLFRGYALAKYYLLAWTLLMIGIIVYSLSEVGIVERNTFTVMIMPLGSALEVILLSLALANNINVLKEEQENAIENTLRLETEKAQLVKEQNVVLEQKVTTRTKELEKANEVLEDKNTELSDAYTDLKNTQSQLVHAEKMSSLGQLTAGIAHEINNPINFVSSNILPLRRDVADIISIFEQTEKFVEGKLEPADFKEIESLKEQFDYDYILTEIDQLLGGMSDGANRTVEIIRGLKLFSRVDEDDLKRVNLEDGINSTLILLNSAVKHHVELVKNYGAIPEVECYGGKMNQVFMNIISNAIQAIRDTGMEDGKITITTTHNNDQVHISIADNGPGMTEEIKQKLFEPFFTTKPVGEGTGLGLSIVYKIIDKINGKIEVNSEPGKGTEFIITLPITNKSKD